jgi:hypothetical protein
MKRFIIAAAFALVGALGFSNSANAQYVYGGYSTFVPGGVVQNRTYATPYGYRTTQNFYSPYSGFSNRQTQYADAWGNRGVWNSGYNPVGNFGYRTGYNYSPFYGPSVYRYGTFGYRW